MDRLPRRRRIYDQFTDNDEPYAENYPLNKQILDYYYKFGQERNLERYLKLNRSLGSKSSSEGSLDQYTARNKTVHFAQPERTRSKSMECLNRGEMQEKHVQTENASPYQPCGERGEEMEDHRNESKQSVERRPYQINVENKVEIAFPSQFYQAMTAGMAIPSHSISSQTTEFIVPAAVTTTAPLATEESPEIEERPIEVSPNQTLKNQSTISEFQPVSPASSIASNKQRLEWDSLGDVGYQRALSEPRVNRIISKSQDKLNVQSKSVSGPTTLTSSKSTGAIPKKKLPAPEVKAVKNSSSPVKGSDKWKFLLRKVKEKSSVILESSGGPPETPSSKILFDADSSKFAQSTPVVSPTVVVAVNEKRKEEKYSQTIEVSTESKSIQAIHEVLDQTTSMSSNHESTAGSFEFIKGSRVDRGCSTMSTNTSSSSDVLPTDSMNSKRTNTLRVRQEISQFLGNVTGKDPSTEVDLRKAIDYIALLFDSRSIDKKSKRKLVEKIISKLLRLKESAQAVAKPPTEVAEIEIQSDSQKTVSGTDTVSDTHHSDRDSTKLEDIRKSEFLKDWLKPMTNSEKDYEKKRRQSMDAEEHVPPVPDKVSTAASSSTDDCAEREKNLQLKCIEREIEYLERIKKLIQVGRMNLMDDTKSNIQAIHRRSNNDRRSESRTTAEESISMVSTRPSSVRASPSDWDSHKNLQIVIKDRSKLNTPPDQDRSIKPVRHEDLKEFVDRRTKEFAERYEKRASVYSAPSSKPYSEPRDSHISGNDRRRPGMVNASTSVNSFEFSCTGPEFVKTASTIESSASKLAAISRTKNKVISSSIETATSMSFSAPIVSSSRNGRSKKKQQLQSAVRSCPESIAYTIVLNPPQNAAQEEGVNADYSSMGLLYDKVSCGPTTGSYPMTTNRMKICESGRFRLEDFLKINRPDFIHNAEERKEEVETARRRRAQKNHEKENLLMSPHLPRGRISKLLEQSLKCGFRI